MTVTKLLSELSTRRIELHPNGEQLVCNAPKGALTQELAAQIRTHKLELLDVLSRSLRGERIAPEPGVAERRHLLSFSQQRVWYLEQVTPNTALHNIAVAWSVNSNVDASALEQALSGIVERHAVLRTRFSLGELDAIAEIEEDVSFRLELVELSAELATQAIDSALSERAQKPFDLTQAPLFRATLVRHGSTSTLLIVAHHIVWDGWSDDVFEGELRRLYAAALRGAPSPLPALPVSYADAAVWQHAYLSGAVLEKKLVFWKRTLGGKLPVLDLPCAHSRPPVWSSEGDDISSQLSEETASKLRELARDHRATEFMLLLTAYGVALQQYTRQTEFVVGTPVANRTQAEVEPLIGFFANTLPLRIRLPEHGTFLDALGSVREVVLDAISHGDVPFERIVEEIDPIRDTSRHPVFQTLFAFEDTAEDTPKPQDLAGDELGLTQSRGVSAKAARVDLSVWVTRQAGRLSLTLEYSTVLFTRATLRSFLDHFESVLSACLAHPARPLASLEALFPAQRTASLVEFNQTRHEEFTICSIPELLQPSFEANGERLAVSAGSRDLSYAVVWERAQALAGALIERGLGPGSLVGVSVARSPELLITLLGVLMAGAAYVPLSHNYPLARLRRMVEDSGVKTVLCDAAAQGVISELNADRVSLELLNAGAEPRRLPAIDPESPAYVIYTSGSTGHPKGVVVPHRAVTNFLQSMRLKPGLTADDTLVAVTTVSFDIAVLELYLPLLVGARVVIASDETAEDAEALLSLIERAEATVMQATPATWRMLLTTSFHRSAQFKALVGGEAFPGDLLKPLCERTSEVWNMYGPTETTVWSTCTKLDPTRGITIGAPIANTQVYLLNERRLPVPLFAPGEIYIAGLGVTSGYLGMPQATEERFIADPFSNQPGALMYQTGDLGWLDDLGTLHHVGRLDSQVKLRGHRIELGEIEAAISRHPSVVEAAVDVYEARAGDARLVAYVHSHAALTITDLRAFLADTLPRHMIPQHLVELERLPLTPSGKVDRRALPPPLAIGNLDSLPPVTPNEKYLAGVWSEILGVESVGRRDNFFDLGGHSLLSIQVVARIKNERSIGLSPRTLLTGSLEQVAQELE